MGAPDQPLIDDPRQPLPMRVDDPAVHGRHVRDTGEGACKRRQTACPKIVTLNEIELAIIDDSG